MKVSKEHIQHLWELYINKKADEQELKTFFSLLENADNDEENRNFLLQLIEETQRTSYQYGQLQPLLHNILQQHPANVQPFTAVTGYRRSVHTIYRRWWAAAVIIIVITGSVYWWLRQPTTGDQPAAVQHQIAQSQIMPGGQKAILTLSDGSSITLDSTANGDITRQGNTIVQKLSDGKLAYSRAGEPASLAPESYNTITTPRGGQYQITLADGTRVWLNAASSLRFPVTFGNTKRSVTVTGEAYFEIARDQVRPFYVHTSRTTVQVLGTAFNINDYNDEPVLKTTLLEGRIKVSLSDGSNALILQQGDQVQLRKDVTGTSLKRVQHVDSREAIAWKEGVFRFNDTPLSSIMRQVQRWYNVEIVYESAMQSELFSGVISRSNNIDEVLRMLELTKTIQFRTEGRKIIVM